MRKNQQNKFDWFDNQNWGSKVEKWSHQRLGWMIEEFSSKAENFDCLNVQICKEEEEENYMKNWLDEFYVRIGNNIGNIGKPKKLSLFFILLLLIPHTFKFEHFLLHFAVPRPSYLQPKAKYQENLTSDFHLLGQANSYA
jgi:hypothetical protein